MTGLLILNFFHIFPLNFESALQRFWEYGSNAVPYTYDHWDISKTHFCIFFGGSDPKLLSGSVPIWTTLEWPFCRKGRFWPHEVSVVDSIWLYSFCTFLTPVGSGIFLRFKVYFKQSAMWEFKVLTNRYINQANVFVFAWSVWVEMKRNTSLWTNGSEKFAFAFYLRQT